VGADEATAANVAFGVGVGKEETEGDCGSTSIATGAILAATVIGTVADTASVTGMVEPGVDPCIRCWDRIAPPEGEGEVIEGGGKRALMIAEGWWSRERCFEGGFEDGFQLDGLTGGVLAIDACWVAVTMLDGIERKKERSRT